MLRFLEHAAAVSLDAARGCVRWGVTGRTAVIAVPYLWLLLFFLIPFIIVLKIAFSETQIAHAAVPAAVRSGRRTRSLQIKLNVGNFLFLVEDSLYWQAYLNSLKVAGDLDAAVPADRLPDGLRHRARRHRRGATSC